jgi:hypothetical protein
MMDSVQYKHYDSNNANTTVIVCTGPCILHLIQVNKTSAQALTVTDTVQGTASNVAILVASISEQSYFYDVNIIGDLKITIPASYVGDITVAFSPL